MVTTQRMKNAPICATNEWENTIEMTPTAETLALLFQGRIAGICVRNFLTPRECEALSHRATELEFKDYANVWPRIGRVGLTVFEHNAIGKSAYFQAVEHANKRIADIIRGIADPLTRVMDWFAKLLPNTQVNIAHEQGYGSYFAGLFRRIEEGTLIHVDFAPAEQPDWGVAGIVSQLSFNVYLESPAANPGVVHVWKKKWTPEDLIFKIPESYGYAEEVIANTAMADIVPEAGMLMIINSQNFHQVTPAGGVRLAVSAAVGRFPDGSIAFWS